MSLPAQAEPKKLSQGETIDLNTASFDDLMRVPGIGKIKARAIFEYRSEHGPFKSVDELDEVTGFGKKSVKRLAPWLRVGDGSPSAAVPTAPVGPVIKPPATEDKASGLPGAPQLQEKPKRPEVVPPKDEGKGTNDVEVL